MLLRVRGLSSVGRGCGSCRVGETRRLCSTFQVGYRGIQVRGQHLGSMAFVDRLVASSNSASTFSSGGAQKHFFSRKSTTTTCAHDLEESPEANPFHLLHNMRFFDIAFNLTDDMYKGIYNGTSPKHPADHVVVMRRARKFGVENLMLTSVNYPSCLETLEYVKQFGTTSNSVETLKEREDGDLPRLCCTIGVHPTHCLEFLKSFHEKEKSDDNTQDEESDGSEFANLEIDQDFAQEQLDKLFELAKRGKEEGVVVAIGETGLDYLRVQFCPKHIQKIFFEKQLELGRKINLPYFLHNRESTEDLYQILTNYRDVIAKNGAVVHSFDGTVEEMKLLCSIDNLYIGLNGCSLKTEQNIETVKEIPLDRIMLETDAPWCEVRPSFHGAKYIKTNFQKLAKKEKYTLDCNMLIKGRNEPCTMIQVAEIVAGIKGVPVEEVAKHAFENASKVFNPPTTD